MSGALVKLRFKYDGVSKLAREKETHLELLKVRNITMYKLMIERSR